ncbi:MATE family efflux transporter [Lachnospiraceae bacterium WCA-9-b2]|uniref:Probable multidrug resistance protein NorM n=1 Tax=Sporofaciens musculi TaxID=2681861 RepID=A0A7X3SIZ4_9FIRM|nr:MATE family efflux transporter [Sporofaciens musculi]MXP75806.1 MATE family efflux transporter [Sporofaciens musculi]
MAAHIKNMTEGKPASLIFTFALPLMVGNVFQQLYTVVDTMVVGKALGVGALAALGAADWLNWMMLGIIQGFTQGFGILMAQEFGAGRYDNLRKSVGHSAVLSLLSALVLLIAGQLLAHPVLNLLKTPPKILPDTLLYLRIMYLGIPIVMAYNLLASILRSLGDGKTPLHAMIVAAITNIALDLLFVLVFGFGIAGAAVATLIAQLISSLFCLYHIRKLELLRLAASDFCITDRRLPLRLLMLGFPMAFQNAIISVGGMIVQFVVNGFGVIFIAGFTATNKLYGVLEVAATSYGYSMVTYAGQNLGAGRTDRIRKGVKSAVLIALLTSLVIALLMLFAGKMILGWFISGTQEEFIQTLNIAYYYLAVMSVCLPILYILHITRSAIQGMGNTVLPLVSGVAEFVMRAMTAILLPMLIGEKGIFYAEIMAWTGATIILVISYFIVIRKTERMLQGTNG